MPGPRASGSRSRLGGANIEVSRFPFNGNYQQTHKNLGDHVLRQPLRPAAAEF
jgi:hypothetical protein